MFDGVPTTPASSPAHLMVSLFLWSSGQGKVEGPWMALYQFKKPFKGLRLWKYSVHIEVSLFLSSRQIYKKQTEWKYVYDPTFLTSVGTEHSGDLSTSKKADSESVDKIEEIEKIKVGSVQQLVQKIELQASDKPCDELKSEVVIASNPEPSDDELSKGCFTQVSCAGKVVVNSGSTTTAGTPQPSSLEKIGTVPTPQPSQKEFRPVPSPRSGH